MDRITKAEVRAKVIAACEQCGSIRKFAASKNIPPSIVAQALSGSRDITEALAQAVGYMRDETFVPIRSSHA